jgi:hypothetical protein
MYVARPVHAYRIRRSTNDRTTRIGASETRESLQVAWNLWQSHTKILSDACGRPWLTVAYFDPKHAQSNEYLTVSLLTEPDSGPLTSLDRIMVEPCRISAQVLVDDA